MEENQKILRIKNLIQENKFVELYDVLKIDAQDTLNSISTPKFLTMKQHPDELSVIKLLEDYENQMSTLIKEIAILCKFRKNEHFDIIEEIVQMFIQIEKNETDGYGYIWAHLRRYPLLLITYCLGISFFKSEELKDLYKLLNKKITQRYAGYQGVQYFDSSLIEGINSYHVFNNIDNITVDVYQYLPKPSEHSNQDETHKRLNANRRIYLYLRSKMLFYFINEGDFKNYFDLYEFFTGLVFMDKRIEGKSLLFAPYGINFYTFSGAGRSSATYQDTFVIKYIVEKEPQYLKVGFFGGKNERLQKAYDEYIKLLRNIAHSYY